MRAFPPRLSDRAQPVSVRSAVSQLQYSLKELRKGLQVLNWTVSALATKFCIGASTCESAPSSMRRVADVSLPGISKEECAYLFSVLGSMPDQATAPGCFPGMLRTLDAYTQTRTHRYQRLVQVVSILIQLYEKLNFEIVPRGTRTLPVSYCCREIRRMVGMVVSGPC